MRLPGTLKALLAQVKRSPVPIGSISVPTKDGPLMLTFSPTPPVPVVAPAKSANIEPAAIRKLPDSLGAFKTPPPFQPEPWAPIGEG